MAFGTPTDTGAHRPGSPDPLRINKQLFQFRDFSGDFFETFSVFQHITICFVASLGVPSGTKQRTPDLLAGLYNIIRACHDVLSDFTLTRILSISVKWKIPFSSRKPRKSS